MISNDLCLLYMCFLGRFIPVEHIKSTSEGYLIYLEGNDITTGIRVTIEPDLLSAVFF